jgi:hypothetical protein
MSLRKQKKGGNILSSLGSAFGDLPDIAKSPEMLATSLLATSPLAPLTPLVSGYLFGKKLFGSGVLEDTAIRQLSKKTGLSKDEILLGKEILEELIDKVKEMNESYGHYIPFLKKKVKNINLPSLPSLPNLPQLQSSSKSSRVEELDDEEENEDILDELENDLNVKKVQNDEITKNLSNRQQQIEKIKNDAKLRKEKLKNLSGGVFLPSDAIDDLSDMFKGYFNHEGQRFMNEDVAPIINNMNPLKSLGLGKKGKKKGLKGGFGIGDVLNMALNPVGAVSSVLGLGKKKKGKGRTLEETDKTLFELRKNLREKMRERQENFFNDELMSAISRTGKRTQIAEDQLKKLDNEIARLQDRIKLEEDSKNKFVRDREAAAAAAAQAPLTGREYRKLDPIVDRNLKDYIVFRNPNLEMGTTKPPYGMRYLYERKPSSMYFIPPYERKTSSIEQLRKQPLPLFSSSGKGKKKMGKGPAQDIAKIKKLHKSDMAVERYDRERNKTLAERREEAEIKRQQAIIKNLITRATVNRANQRHDPEDEKPTGTGRKKVGGLGVGDILGAVFNPIGTLASAVGLGKKKGKKSKSKKSKK